MDDEQDIAALRANEARLSALFAGASDIIAVLQNDGRWYASPAGTRILGHPPGYEPPGGLLSLVHPDDLLVAAQALEEVHAGTRAPHESARIRIRAADDSYRHFDCVATDLSKDPNVHGVVITARDVTAQKAAEDAHGDAERRFAAAFERAPMGIAFLSLDGMFLDANEALCTMVDRRKEELLGTEAVRLLHPEDEAMVTAEADDRINGRRDSAPAPIRLLRADGSPVWITADVAIVPDADGEPSYVIALVSDVTDRKELEARLEYQALHDPLTGLPNRAWLRTRLDAAWARRNPEAPLAVLFVDLDRFKDVNDRLGHDAGDELLMLAARRLERAVRAGDGVARFGGDEFVVLCDSVSDTAEARAIAYRVREALSVDYRLSAGTASIAACVGVAVDIGYLSVDEVLREADHAAYRAKDRGRNRVEIASDPADRVVHPLPA